MLCPDCGQDNIAGADTCANCLRDLTCFDQPVGTTPLEACIVTETLAALKPKPPVILPPDTTVAEAVAILCEKDIGCVLVGRPDRTVGIFTERDILLRVAHQYERARSQPISAYMTPDPETLDIQATVAFAINRMAIGDFRHVPVTKDGRLVGVISVRDLLPFLSQWYPDLIPARTAT